MAQHNEQLATLEEIRSLMQRSTRFTSLSGLSGIVAGLVALVGAGLVSWYLNQQGLSYTDVYQNKLSQETSTFLLLVIGAVLLLALSAVVVLTWFKAQKAKQSIWHYQSQRLFTNLSIPLAVGGVFCLVLLHHNLLYLVAPSMLIFYGLALIHSSKYTFTDFRYLGLGQIALGLLASFQIEYGLLAWVAGFGALNIIYGALLYFKYEKSGPAANPLASGKVNT